MPFWDKSWSNGRTLLNCSLKLIFHRHHSAIKLNCNKINGMVNIYSNKIFPCLTTLISLTILIFQTIESAGNIHLDRRCLSRLGNQFTCWLEMAVSPLAPQAFRAPNRSRCRLRALNLTTSGAVMDQDWNQTVSWHTAEENVLEVVSEQ